MLILRICRKPVIQGPADPLTHLCRSRVGKGHHQKPVNIYRMLPVTHHPDDPLHEHRRLPRSRRRRYKQITSPCINYLLLFFRKINTHLCLHTFRSFSFHFPTVHFQCQLVTSFVFFSYAGYRIALYKCLINTLFDIKKFIICFKIQACKLSMQK